MEKMEKIIRAMIVMIILLAGLALIPYIDLPAEALTWQLFSGVYEPTLDVNFVNGKPGSYFLFNGSNYPPDSTAEIRANGELLGTVQSDGSGNLSFILSTTNTDPGTYTISADVDINASAAANITLDTNAPLRPMVGDGPIFSLTPTVFLPAIIESQ
jgi:hypothetical protein